MTNSSIKFDPRLAERGQRFALDNPNDAHFQFVMTATEPTSAAVRQAEPIYEDICQLWRKRIMPTKRSAKDDASIMRRHLKPAFAQLPISEISADRIEELRARLMQTLKPKTVRNILTLLRVQFAFDIAPPFVVKTAAISEVTLGLLS